MESYAVVNAVSEDNIYLKVNDVVEIERIPEKVKEFVGRYVQGMKIMDNGLPASGFIGREGSKITGIFRYGEITFISYVGDKSNIEGEDFIHIFSNVSEEDYNLMKEYADKQVSILEDEVQQEDK